MAGKMKDSGIEWIRNIPQHWTIGRIGQLYTERKEKVSDVDFPPLSVTMKGIMPQLSTAAKTDAHDDRKLVCKGDFVINSRSDRRGSCGISPYDGSVSLINTILTPRGEMHPVYYEWLFHSTMFSDEFYKWGHGIVNDLWTTNWQDMKKISVPRPPYEEQVRIASYLNLECAHIDSVIMQTRASIEEYKKLKQAIITRAVTKGIQSDRVMKDSGVEWIGEIPLDWEVASFKQILLKKIDNRGRTPDLNPFDEGIPLLEVSSLGGKYPDTSKIKKYISQVSHDKYIRDDLESGDILITTVGATIGKSSIVPEEFNYCIAQNVVGYRVRSNHVPLFWHYYFQSTAFLDMFVQYNKSF